MQLVEKHPRDGIGKVPESLTKHPKFPVLTGSLDLTKLKPKLSVQ